MVFVSSPRNIKELDKAPDEVLSLNGAAKHVSALSLPLSLPLSFFRSSFLLR